MRRILCAVDFSAASRKAFEAAVALGRDLQAGILLVHVDPDPPRVRGMYQGEDVVRLEKKLREEQASEDAVRLSEWAEEARAEDLDVKVLLRDGDPVQGILQEATERAVDLIVVGRSGKGATARLLLGSVSRDITQRAEVPVVVVPDA